MIVLIISVLLIVSCQQTPTTKNSQPVLSEESLCVKGGGVWTMFRNTCVDNCKVVRTKGIICGQALTEGCDCGPAKCWNGNSCENN